MAMDVVDYEIKGAEMQFVEVELDPGEAAIGEAGSMMFMDAGITMDTVFGDGSAAAGRLLRQAARRRQAARHRRVALHHRLHQPGRRQAARRLRSAVPRQDPRRWTCTARRHADLPEGRVPLRRARRVAGHRVPAAALGRLLRRRGLHHAEARRRRPRLRACRRHRAQARAAARRDAVHRHRLRRGLHAERQLRDPVRRQDQDRAVRRRGPVLRQGHRPRHGVAAEPAVLAPRVARVRGRAADGPRRREEGSVLPGLPPAACSAASSAATTNRDAPCRSA